ncbi:MAG: hypothetical protein VSS75_006695 [Candidatus Parabeggiatoa sp.]|nr:hypothetical protein [Candidatus Parabeggiatoa sp.]
MEHKREAQRREHRVSTSYRSKTRGTETRASRLYNPINHNQQSYENHNT